MMIPLRLNEQIGSGSQVQGAPKQKQALDRITGHDLRVNVCAFYHAGREKILKASASKRQLCGPDCLWASKEVTAVTSEDGRGGGKMTQQVSGEEDREVPKNDWGLEPDWLDSDRVALQERNGRGEPIRGVGGICI